MENNSPIPAADPTFLRRYGIALLAAAGVIAVRLALMPLLGTRPPYITFYLGIVIAAAYGGIGPGMLVTFIGVAFGFVVLPAGPVVIAQEATRLGLFVLSGVGICLVAEGMHRQRRRVQEQAQELVRVAEKLAELDRAKTAFFANVSHEFRTPLTLMIGPTEEALNSPQRTLAGEDLATVHRNALRLLKLVNTLLDFARIEAGRIDANYQPTDLSRLTADLASVFRSAVEKAGLSLVVDCAPLSEKVYVDRGMWEKIVLNLLSNAFKFTFEGEIAISVRQLGNEVELAVRDTGTGIPDSELPQIFERFHYVKNPRARTHEGTGIGLALVKELVKLHAGRIEVESRLGEGTTFRVRLPLGTSHLPADRIEAQPTQAATSVGAAPFVEEALRWIPDQACGDAATDPQAIPAGDFPFARKEERAPARVLVAEDNADMRQYLRQLLERHWTVEAAPDGATALAAAVRNPPDLVLADVMMPGLDGFELLQRLRAESSTREIPIILLSARAGEEARVEGLAAGADDYLVKPFSARELVTRIGAHLELNRVRREASRKVRQSEERLSAILEQLPVGVGVIDTEGRYILANNDMRGYVGSSMPSRDPVRRERWRAFDAEGRPVPPEQWPDARALKGEVVSSGMEFVFTDDQGREHWTLVSSVPFRAEEGAIAGAITVVQDINERRRAEEALKEAKEAAEIANRAKSEFLANMSHEIRTPMTVFMATLEYLLQIDRDPERRPLLEMADQSANRLRALIEDVLDFSRIEARRVDLEEEPFELRTCVREAVDMFTLPSREKSLRLETEVAPDAPRLIVGDQNRLGQILVNLIGNAVKFTHEGEIRVCVQPRGDFLEFAVADTGIGIPEEKRDRLFESFTQADSSLTRKYGGTGLGLAISQGLVELMGGEISARGREGRGSVFTFTIPLKTADKQIPAAAATPKVTAEHSVGARILLAEDEPLVREMITMMLNQKGWRPEIAETGQEAVEKWEGGSFDLILMDLQMPETSGLEATRTIREKEAGGGRRTCIIGLTAHARREIREECLEAGMDQVLNKPVKMDDLYAAIGNCLMNR
ncbi:ATP-binding protein [Geoalkalibacter halelectricus]|uniref:histidine kinase n=1 Tax=Geoalkalibacter halelectricus TaxID=2847045 RepID=A0ABY5ZNI0_9BACT|nr:ATP-binding protein [Geoalkalibacter halelectricus]MDO3379463.1 ATP-binding protein [Geoalkalibacter halelectricus]UWZ79522.1 ATP-binding protein [Geoalkalibacter halelectricus]